MDNQTTINIPRETKLDIECHSLKLHIAKLNYSGLETAFKTLVEKAYADANISLETHALDLDAGKFVEKTSTQQRTHQASK